MSWLPDWLTGFDRENFERGQQADNANAELQKSLHDRGLISDENYQISLDHYAADDAFDPDEQIVGAFDDELADRTKAVRDFASGAIGASLKATLGLIPWQVWLGVAGYVAWRLGVFNGVLAKAKR
jgi:hypothetical protein